jgi:hypothetical protein
MKLVATVVSGPNYQKLAALSVPPMLVYAERIGADFLSLTGGGLKDVSASWEKLRLKALLEKYEQVIFIDADILVKPTAPNLFDIVPTGQLGMVNEAAYRPPGVFKPVYECWVGEMAAANQIPMPVLTMYFNTGVIVMDRTHLGLFDPPTIYVSKGMKDQDWFNLMIHRHKFQMVNLPVVFNWFPCGVQKSSAHLIHYHYTKEKLDHMTNDAREFFPGNSLPLTPGRP